MKHSGENRIISANRHRELVSGAQIVSYSAKLPTPTAIHYSCSLFETYSTQ